MSDGYTTGLPTLDEAIGGGLPPGTLTGVTAPPTSAAPLLGHAVALHNTGVHVLTTYREPERLRSELAAVADQSSVDATNIPNTTDSDGRPCRLRITSIEPREMDSVGDEDTPDWFAPVVEHQAAIGDAADSLVDSLSVVVVDSLSSVATIAGRDATTDVISRLRTFAAEHQVAVLAFFDDKPSESGGETFGVRAADILLTYDTADLDSDSDVLTVRRVRRAANPGLLNGLPDNLPLSVSTVLKQNPDDAY